MNQDELERELALLLQSSSDDVLLCFMHEIKVDVASIMRVAKLVASDPKAESVALTHLDSLTDVMEMIDASIGRLMTTVTLYEKYLEVKRSDSGK